MSIKSFIEKNSVEKSGICSDPLFPELEVDPRTRIHIKMKRIRRAALNQIKCMSMVMVTRRFVRIMLLKISQLQRILSYSPGMFLRNVSLLNKVIHTKFIPSPIAGVYFT